MEEENLIAKMYKGEELFVHIGKGKLVIQYADHSLHIIRLTKEAFFALPYYENEWSQLVSGLFNHGIGHVPAMVNTEPVLRYSLRLLRDAVVGNTLQIPNLEKIVSKEEIEKFLEKFGKFTGESEPE